MSTRTIILAMISVSSALAITWCDKATAQPPVQSPSQTKSPAAQSTARTASNALAEYCKKIPKNPAERTKEQVKVLARGTCLMIFKEKPLPDPSTHAGEL